ncbi:hypothetical protein V1514DRAFT_329520 [Lipomyces japonicus]|uniref:uncharacterized protein n=1 Tax=Lipomyces japonicus TaxID=56871 RepID=UPI0034CD43BA
MIRIDKKNGKGYLRAGKMLLQLGQHDKAVKVYSLALKNVNPEDKLFSAIQELYTTARLRADKQITTLPVSHQDQQSRQDQHQRSRTTTTTVTDPLQILPTELIDRVLALLSFRQMASLQLVCRHWRKVVRESPRLWAELDFRQCNRTCVTKSMIRTCLQLAGANNRKRGPRAVYLSNVIARDVQACVDMVCRPGAGLQILQAVEPGMRLPLPVNHNQQPAGWFMNLRVLSVGMTDIARMLAVVARARFPQLHTLNVVHSGAAKSRPGTVRLDEPVDDVDDDTAAKPVLDCMRVLNIDAGMDMVTIPQADMTALLARMPYLTTLSLNGVCHHDGSNNVEDQQQQGSRLDLSALVGRLAVFRLARSSLRLMPILPDTIEQLSLLESTPMPRIVREADQIMTTTVSTTTMRYYEDEVLGESGMPVREQEYANVRGLELKMHARLNASDLFAIISRCDGTRLTSLVLDACAGLDLRRGRGHHETQENRVLAWQQVMPCLRKLVLRNNLTVNDEVVSDLCAGLSELEYVDLSATDVSIAGILRMLAGEIGDHDGHGGTRWIRMTELTDRVQKMAVDRVGGSGIRIKTLVLNNCGRVSIESATWLRGLGIIVEHDLSDMYLTPVVKRRRL